MAEIRYLTASDVLALTNWFQEQLGYARPILRAGGQALLESAVNRAQTAAFYASADVVQQAAALANGIALNHPFLDGNGRVGRLLITLLLYDAGVLRDPLLYLSLYLKERRSEYYRLLDVVRREGDWEAWLAFLLEGIRLTADGAVETAQRLTTLFREDRGNIETTGRRAGSALRVHEALKARPILSMPEVCRSTSLSFPAASSAMELLIERVIARELTGKRRNRLFVYDRYLQILNEETTRPHPGNVSTQPKT